MKISIPFYSNSGESREAISLNVAEKFSILNTKLVSQALYIEQNRVQIKAGLAKTKGEISGGGRKPHKQKGTGRARAGSNRSPLWRGGGVTFGPTGINKVLVLPKKMKDLAFLQLIVAKMAGKELAVIENVKIESAKTKDANIIASKVGEGKKIEMYVSKEEINDCLPWRNLAQVSCNTQDKISFTVLSSSKKLVISEEVYKQIQAKLS